MAITGTIYGSTGNEYIDSKIEWSYTVNESANTSKVTAALYYKRNNTGYTTYGSGTFSITIDKTKTVLIKELTITESSWVKALEATVTVNHKDDGTRSITITGTGSISGTSLTSTSCSGTVRLFDIPRASTISSASNVTLGQNCSVRWTPLSKSFRFKLKFELGYRRYTTDAIHPNQTSAYTYTGYPIPLEVANDLPSATGTMKVTLYTYSNSSATMGVGSPSSKTFTVTVPNNSDTKPSVSMTLTPVSSLGSAFSSLYIQGKSKVKATLSAKGKFFADIKSYSMSVGGKTYGSPYESECLTTAGTITVKGGATDSRGYSNEVTKNITVIPYSKPKIQAVSGESEVVAARCDEDGNLTDSGTFLKIRAKRSYSPVTSGGTQYNFCKIRFRYKSESGTYTEWEDILASDSLDSDEVSTGALLDGALSVRSSYIVQVQVIDVIGDESSTTITIPTEKVYLHKAGSRGSLGFGEYAEEDDVISIAKDRHVRLKSSINDVRMYGKALSGVSAFDIATHFDDFTGSGSERQVFFVFGEASGKIVYGVAMVSNSGTTLWEGTTGVTLTTKSGGVLTVTLPAVANDIFTIISSRDFSV